MRLIDADALEQLIDVKGANLGITNANRCNFKDMLKMTPTVDAIEVVRCKECKNHADEEPGMVYCPHVIGGWVNEMGFCADGERKEND